MSRPWDRRVALGKNNPRTSATPGRSPEPSATRRSRPAQEPRGWYSRGYLPHLDTPGLIQHVTFHLADSLPMDAIDRLQAEIDGMPEADRPLSRRKRIQALLDSGLGSCLLRHAACAEVVENSLLFGDGTRYRLLAWVVMPNHVHVLIQQMDGWMLAKVVQSWKRHTSRQIHKLFPGSPSCTRPPGSPSCTRHDAFPAEYNSAIPGAAIPEPLWQRDYWDRYIRDERHYRTAERYVEDNPVMAGLVESAEHWPWGSARFKAASSCGRG